MDITLDRPYDERDLIQACIEQERWAQRIIYEEYYSGMKAICMRYAHSDSDAEDILHDGFLKVFRHIGKYKVGTSLPAWIKRIMINTSIDYYRKEKRRRTEDIERAFGLTADEADVISACSEREILQAVQQLTTTYRMVFNMYVIEGYSHREIGEHLGINESTSRSNLVKARNKLKDTLLNSLRYERRK